MERRDGLETKQRGEVVEGSREKGGVKRVRWRRVAERKVE